MVNNINFYGSALLMLYSPPCTWSPVAADGSPGRPPSCEVPESTKHREYFR